MCSQDKQNNGREVAGWVSCPVWGGEVLAGVQCQTLQRGRLPGEPWIKAGIADDVNKALA